jgi:hypothetical protein
LCRKFFTVVMTFNITAMVLAIAGVWDYPRRYTGAMVLGNLYTAILIRNELFGRFLYLVVNTLFAKVRFSIIVPDSLEVLHHSSGHLSDSGWH